MKGEEQFFVCLLFSLSLSPLIRLALGSSGWNGRGCFPKQPVLASTETLMCTLCTHTRMQTNHTCTKTHAHTCNKPHMHTCAKTHAHDSHVHTLTCTHNYTRRCANHTHAHSSTHIHAHTQACTHSHTHTHTHTHSHKHAHIHTMCSAVSYRGHCKEAGSVSAVGQAPGQAAYE